MSKIKGTAIATVVRLLNERGDLSTVPDSLRSYVDNRVLVASWYPTQDFLDLLTHLALFAPEGKDPWIWMGRSVAFADLSQIYSFMVQKGSPMGTLLRLPRLWRLYHDSGRADVGVLEEDRVQVQVADFAYADEDFCRWMKGYLMEILRISGARAVKVRSLRTGSLDRPAKWLAHWQV